jgi:ABC-2 type transport system ATP-binding protein
MIEVRNLTKRYGPVAAVDDITFDVKEGEVVGFLGPNGAGKSTTIRILTCYHPATSGSANVAGYDVFRESMKVREQIGYLPESAPLYPEMRVREYLHFRGKLHGMSRPERNKAIDRVSELCWLSEFVNRPIGHLSKGMRQRTGLADVLLHNPKVLILDEPTVGLDPTQIREAQKLISDLGQQHTILFSSHILPQVEAVCTRTIIIAKGKIVAEGTPAELREHIGADSRLIGEIKGPTEEVISGVKSINGVSHVSADTNMSGGWNRLYINCQNGRDVREDIHRLTIDKNWPLREMRREVGSLEEFFIRITARQTQDQLESERTGREAQQ